MMNKMAVNSRWYPLKHQVVSRQINKHINFGEIWIEYPIVSHYFGFYRKAEFYFDDLTLEDLLNEFIIWS